MVAADQGSNVDHIAYVDLSQHPTGNYFPEMFSRSSAERDQQQQQAAIHGSRTLAPANVSKVINKWLFLYPDELRCANDDDISSTYEQYVANAETQVRSVFESCEGFEWPTEAVSMPLASHHHPQWVDCLNLATALWMTFITICNASEIRV